MRRRRRPTQGSPPTQECSSYLPERGRIPCFAGSPDRPPHIQPTNIPGAPRRCHALSRAQGGQGRIGSIPVLPEEKPSVDSATKAEGGTGAGLGEHGGSSKCRSRGLWGGHKEEVWHPSWALKNEMVERQGQWGRHLAEGTARAKAERREIAWSRRSQQQSYSPGSEGKGALLPKRAVAMDDQEEGRRGLLEQHIPVWSGPSP